MYETMLLGRWNALVVSHERYSTGDGRTLQMPLIFELPLSHV